jgi:hypothetical protein
METLDRLALTVVGGNTRMIIPYAKIKRTCDENSIPYKDRGRISSLALTKLLELAGIPAAGKALILYANNYSESIPPWRQEGLTVLFDERYSSFGTPTKLLGRYLNKAGQINGFYKIEAV